LFYMLLKYLLSCYQVIITLIILINKTIVFMFFFKQTIQNKCLYYCNTLNNYILKLSFQVQIIVQGYSEGISLKNKYNWSKYFN